ncbi:hypothetical protein GCM10010510_20380 [Streptomyces anandii JCM 4720]|nr:hypothetical protein GCM10010510_20380 [Streptomyces anandii JCM 4720]
MAGAAGQPTHVQASVTGANTLSTRANRIGSGRCTTEIMIRAGPGHATAAGGLARRKDEWVREVWDGGPGEAPDGHACTAVAENLSQASERKSRCR